MSQHLLLGLEDLLGDLRYARRSVDLGHLALLAYCEVRRWARMAGDEEVAARSSAMITRAPHATREEFLVQIDDLIAELATRATDAADVCAATHSRELSPGSVNCKCAQ